MILSKILIIMLVLINVGVLCYLYTSCGCQSSNVATTQEFKPEITHPASIVPKYPSTNSTEIKN